MKFDSDGNVLWNLNFSNIFPTKNCYKFSAVNLPDFSYFYVLVTVKNNTNNLNTYLMKISNTGHIVWSQRLNNVVHQEIYDVTIALTTRKTLLAVVRGAGESNRTFIILRLTLNGNYINQVSFTSSFETINWVYVATVRELSNNNMILLASFEGYRKNPPRDISSEEKWSYTSLTTFFYKINETSLIESRKVLDATIQNIYFLNSDTVYLSQQDRVILYNIKSNTQVEVDFPTLVTYYTTHGSEYALTSAPTTDGHIKVLYATYSPWGKSEYVFYIIDYQGRILNYTQYIFSPNKSPNELYGFNWDILLLVEPDNVLSAVGCTDEFIEHPGPDKSIYHLSLLSIALSKSSDIQTFYPLALIFSITLILLVITEFFYDPTKRNRQILNWVAMLVNLNTFLIVAFMSLPEIAKFILYNTNLLEYNLLVDVLTTFNSPLMLILSMVFVVTFVLLNLVLCINVVKSEHIQHLTAKMIAVTSILAFTFPLLFSVMWLFWIGAVVILFIYGVLAVIGDTNKKTVTIAITPWVFFVFAVVLLVFSSFYSRRIVVIDSNINTPEQISQISLLLSVYPELYFYNAYSLLISVPVLVLLVVIILSSKMQKLIIKNIIPLAPLHDASKNNQGNVVSSWIDSALALSLLGYPIGILTLRLLHPIIFATLAFIFIGLILFALGIIMLESKNKIS